MREIPTWPPRIAPDSAVALSSGKDSATYRLLTRRGRGETLTGLSGRAVNDLARWRDDLVPARSDGEDGEHFWVGMWVVLLRVEATWAEVGCY